MPTTTTTAPSIARPSEAKPPGWRDPRDLLGEFLDRFGMRDAPRRGSTPTRRHLTGVASDDLEERTRAWAHEVEAAAPTLQRLLDRVRALGARPPLRRTNKAQADWFDVVDDWNGGLALDDARELPPLCHECGTPVLGLAPLRKSGGGVSLGACCSDACRHRANARASKRKTTAAKRRTKSKPSAPAKPPAPTLRAKSKP